ncbi:MAG: hypothetical protein AAGE80_09715 [Pseudomonadota bacterium]
MLLSLGVPGTGLFGVMDDVVRFAHLIAIAIGFGTVVSTDFLSVWRADKPLTAEYLRAVEAAHFVIVPALVVAWITGICLIGMLTGFDPAEFTTKLWVKLAVVTQLVVTACLIKRFVMPILRLNEGHTLMEVPLGDKLVMAFCAGMSMAGWGSAILLGGLAMAKLVPGWLLIAAIVGLHIAVVNVALWSAVSLHDRVRVRAQRVRLAEIRGY